MIKKQDDYNNDNIYIGSCCNFSRRKCEHKRTCNNSNNKNHNFKVHKYIRENGGWDSWCMTKIIDYPCNSKSDLNIMERRYIDEYKSKLNCYIPTRTYKEYYDDNKEKIKQYRNDNKEKIAEQRKQYYKDKKEKIKQYYNDNIEKIKERQKQYYDDNKEKRKERQKQYYDDNKEKKKQKVICDNCGSEILKETLSRHKRSKKCLTFHKS